MNKYASNSSKRCVLEIDLEYPKELRKLHNDYPLAPNKIEITNKILDPPTLAAQGEARKGKGVSDTADVRH